MSDIHPVMPSGMQFNEMKENACNSTTWNSESEGFLQIQGHPRLNAKFEVSRAIIIMKYKILHFHCQTYTTNKATSGIRWIVMDTHRTKNKRGPVPEGAVVGVL